MVGNPFEEDDIDRAKRMIDAYIILGIIVANNLETLLELIEFTGWDPAKVSRAVQMLRSADIIAFESDGPVSIN